MEVEHYYLLSKKVVRPSLANLQVVTTSDVGISVSTSLVTSITLEKKEARLKI